MEIVRRPEVEHLILWIRGIRVMIDADLAELYGVSTKALNQAVKRNRDRFPQNFMFRLTQKEKEEVVTNCDHLQRLRFAPSLPYVFTEHGTIMLANVLRSERAIKTSIQVVQAFLKLREMVLVHKDLALKVAELEKKYDPQFKVVFDAIRQLMTPPAAKEKRIGF